MRNVQIYASRAARTWQNREPRIRASEEGGYNKSSDSCVWAVEGRPKPRGHLAYAHTGTVQISGLRQPHWHTHTHNGTPRSTRNNRYGVCARRSSIGPQATDDPRGGHHCALMLRSAHWPTPKQETVGMVRNMEQYRFNIKTLYVLYGTLAAQLLGPGIMKN